MLDSLDTSLSGLDDETRLALANLLSLRNEHAEVVMEMNKRKISVLMNPSREAEAELTEFINTVVAPLRSKLTEDTFSLLAKAVDLEQIKGLLSAAAIGLMGSINFGLLLNVLGLDPDMMTEFGGLLKDLADELKD